LRRFIDRQITTEYTESTESTYKLFGAFGVFGGSKVFVFPEPYPEGAAFTDRISATLNLIMVRK